jgi:hypothetical protein
LRTPLAHVRLVLERGREKARDLGQLQAVVDRAIAGLDRSLTVLFRIRRRAVGGAGPCGCAFPH